MEIPHNQNRTPPNIHEAVVFSEICHLLGKRGLLIKCNSGDRQCLQGLVIMGYKQYIAQCLFGCIFKFDKKLVDVSPQKPPKTACEQWDTNLVWLNMILFIRKEEEKHFVIKKKMLIFMHIYRQFE